MIQVVVEPENVPGRTNDLARFPFAQDPRRNKP